MIHLSEAPQFLMPLLAGAILGAFFFGGLWWTIQRRLPSKTYALWFLGSLLVRTGLTVTGFYFVADGHWERLVICLVGFLAARFAILKWIREPEGFLHAP